MNNITLFSQIINKLNREDFRKIGILTVKSKISAGCGNLMNCGGVSFWDQISNLHSYK